MSESPIASVEHLPLAVVVHILSSELRKNEVDEICRQVDKALAAAPSLPFILDMAAVSFAGSLALGVLVGLNKEFRTRGQRMIFVGLQGGMRELIGVSRINLILEIMQDVPTALHRLGSNP